MHIVKIPGIHSNESGNSLVDSFGNSCLVLLIALVARMMVSLSFDEPKVQIAASSLLYLSVPISGYFGMRDANPLLVKVFMLSALVISVAAFIYAASAVALFVQGSSTPVGGRKVLDLNSNPILLRVLSTLAVGLASSRGFYLAFRLNKQPEIMYKEIARGD